MLFKFEEIFFMLVTLAGLLVAIKFGNMSTEMVKMTIALTVILFPIIVRFTIRTKKALAERKEAINEVNEKIEDLK